MATDVQNNVWEEIKSKIGYVTVYVKSIEIHSSYSVVTWGGCAQYDLMQVVIELVEITDEEITILSTKLIKDVVPKKVDIERSSVAPEGILELVEDEDFIGIVHPKKVHENAVAHGWWDEDKKPSLPEALALIHSEVSEALEAYRNEIPEGEKHCVSEELADVIIRVFDVSEAFGYDILSAVEKKHNYNKTRSYRHGGKKC